MLGDRDWWDRRLRGRTGWTQRKRFWAGVAVMVVVGPFIAWRILDPSGFNGEDWRRGADPDWVFGCFVLSFVIGLVLAAVGLRRIVQDRGDELIDDRPESRPVDHP